MSSLSELDANLALPSRSRGCYNPERSLNRKARAVGQVLRGKANDHNAALEPLEPADTADEEISLGGLPISIRVEVSRHGIAWIHILTHLKKVTFDLGEPGLHHESTFNVAESLPQERPIIAGSEIDQLFEKSIKTLAGQDEAVTVD